MNAILDIENLVVYIIEPKGENNNSDGRHDDLRKCSNEELVARINREVGIPHWVRSRGDYLAFLYKEFISRDLDCSSFIRGNCMWISKPLRLEGNKVVVH